MGDVVNINKNRPEKNTNKTQTASKVLGAILLSPIMAVGLLVSLPFWMTIGFYRQLSCEHIWFVSHQINVSGTTQRCIRCGKYQKVDSAALERL